MKQPTFLISWKGTVGPAGQNIYRATKIPRCVTKSCFANHHVRDGAHYVPVPAAWDGDEWHPNSWRGSFYGCSVKKQSNSRKFIHETLPEHLTGTQLSKSSVEDTWVKKNGDGTTFPGNIWLEDRREERVLEANVVTCHRIPFSNHVLEFRFVDATEETTEFKETVQGRGDTENEQFRYIKSSSPIQYSCVGIIENPLEKHLLWQYFLQVFQTSKCPSNRTRFIVNFYGYWSVGSNPPTV